ncbi:helix-turn-helix domain-containing protein [Sinomonas atrocyanea]|uniref:helix-turn-helix domain-containing protein n=1 Tax=Sinomonas atrocyanea TaxID=37927 RepID=UPI00278A1A20|nr:helix-turn-helix domain-containing protein [Sinomonas atrocyanea]MDQ0261201.1 transcriptional regulator with XRE-family HTH domain [Sinomonas atrocyanea]MDR6619865.1 transcriptional regulator with XRE-family HTH domain [Sinomonas atrocyanea]
MGIEFGRMLRAERLRRGLTQAQLGEGAYEPSYISMLETGRLEPSAQAIQELAGRLASAPHAMPWWSGPPMVGEAEYVFSSLCAQAACDVREYARASSHAAIAARLAEEGSDTSGWWEMTFIQAECLMREGRLTRSLRTARDLLEHSALAGDRELEARAHQLYAEICHRHGRLEAAVEHAHRATELSEGLPGRSATRVASLCTLIHALADSGRTEAAWEWCANLGALVAKAAMDRLVCRAEWVIGKVAFVRSDEAEGARHHERAAQFLLALEDIELWACFNRSAAAARLDGGILGPDTITAIERAELALAIAGGSDADQLETALVRARWLYLTGQLAQSAQILQGIHRERNLLGPHVTAEACLLYGQCLKDLGQDDEALRALEEAHEQFRYAGIPLKAERAKERILELRQSAHGQGDAPHAVPDPVGPVRAG